MYATRKEKKSFFGKVPYNYMYQYYNIVDFYTVFHMFVLSLWVTMTPVFLRMGETVFYIIKKECIAYNHEYKMRKHV